MSQYEFSVSVQTQYLPEQSEPDAHQFAFAYTLTIRNTGQVAAQLISRHWIITDSDDVVQEVKGLGVVGNQPLLPPGYSSSSHRSHHPKGIRRESHRSKEDLYRAGRTTQKIPRHPQWCSM